MILRQTCCAGHAQFNKPLGIAVAPGNGTLFVADSGNNRIRMIHRDGTTHTIDERSVVPAGGEAEVLKDGIELLAGEVIDTSRMKAAALRAYFAEEIARAKEEGVLFSLHLKATMMKVSDPAMFGHCVSVFFGAALDKHADALASRRGLGAAGAQRRACFW